MDIAALTAKSPKKLVPGTTYLEYEVIPALRSGNIKAGLVSGANREYLISPLHIKQAFEGYVFTDSDSLQFGRALHCLCLEPEEFEARYCFFEGRRDKRTKEYKDFLEANEGKEVLKRSGEHSWDWCLQAGVQLCQDAAVKPYISVGMKEVTGLAPIEGVPCKVRYDWLSASEHAICDIKSARSIGPLDFWYSFKRFGYGIQLAMYWHVYELITKRRLPVVVIAIENHPPFSSVVYEVPEELLERELEVVKRVAGKVRECLKSGEWPNFAGGQAMALALPDWEMNEVDQVDWSE